MTLDGWSDDEGATATTSQWNVNAYGTVQVHGHRVGESGETVEVQRTFHIVPAEVDGVTSPSAALQPCQRRIGDSIQPGWTSGNARFRGTSTHAHGRRMGVDPRAVFGPKEGCPTQKWVIQ